MAIAQKKYPKAACSIMQDISCWMGWVPHIILQRMIVILGYVQWECLERVLIKINQMILLSTGAYLYRRVCFKNQKIFYGYIHMS
jgi:hypothetical protein